MNLEVFRTDKLPGNNLTLLAYGGNLLYKLVGKDAQHYRWVCYLSTNFDCEGFIITSPSLSNPSLIRVNGHGPHHHDCTTLITDLITLMKNHNQSDVYANGLVTVSSVQNNSFENVYDDAVLMLIKYLNNSDCGNLMLAFPNLLRLAQYECFGSKIIFDVYQRCCENKYEIILKNSIQSVTIRGNRDFPATTSISSTFLQKLQLKCPNINNLIFYIQCFDCQPMHYLLNYKELKSLTVKYSNSLPYTKEHQGNFNLSNISCLDIETIILKGCNWFREDHMMLIFQLKKLKYLSLKKCARLNHCIYLKRMNYGITFENLQVCKRYLGTLQLNDIRREIKNKVFMLTMMKSIIYSNIK